MTISIELAERVIAAHRAANRPIANIQFLTTMWSERQAHEKIAELERFMPRAKNKKMGTTDPAAEKSPPADPNILPASEFRAFIENFPREALNGVPKYQVYAVGLAMSSHCTWKTGTGMRLTVKAIEDMTGVGHKSINRVIELLQSGSSQMSG